MAVSKYFTQNRYNREQDLLEDLTIESIKQYGIDVKYLPLSLVNQDFLLGEDRIAAYNDAIDVEVYLKDAQGFGGEGDFLSKFNLEIHDTVTFTMARKRFAQISSNKFMTEGEYNYQQEDADTDEYGNTASYELETVDDDAYAITATRPLEGDAIYFPFNQKVFKIKFVEHESVFYQLGKLYAYDLQCELMDRDWTMQTGNTVIDTAYANLSMNELSYQMLNEDGDMLVNEDGGFIIQDYRLETHAPSANNEVIIQESVTFVNWSEKSPFGELDRF